MTPWCFNFFCWVLGFGGGVFVLGGGGGGVWWVLVGVLKQAYTHAKDSQDFLDGAMI